MIYVVMSIRDNAVAAFNRPFFVQHVGMAVRSFKDEVNSAESPMAKHPEDFLLFELGTFDEETGKMQNLEAPRQVMRAIDVKERPNER